MRSFGATIAFSLAAVLLAAPAHADFSDKAKVGNAAAQQDALICRYTFKTGSIVQKEKKCFSRKDWNKINEAAQSGARALVEGGNGGTPY